ncbi:MAG: NAD-dependent epimerase/dehydratase family protein, partial [Euryarchaeota archaeon]
IGTHLCAKLHSSGHHVISLDVNHGKDQPWECLTADIRDELVLEGIDYVIHLAAQVSVSQSIINPDETLSINVDGTSSIISAAEESRVKRILFASSAAVYGDSDQIPTTEGAPLIPQSAYAVSKIVGEELLKRTEIETCSMRFFNVYGSDNGLQSNYAAVIPIFRNAIENNQPLTIYGDGTQVRDFIHVDDLVEVIIRLMKINSIPSEVNIATGEGTNLLKLAELLTSDVERGYQINYEESREGDIHTSLADISMLRKYIPDLEFTSLPEGIKLE